MKKRSEYIMIRVTPEEKTQLERMADYTGLSQSAFVRCLIRSSMETRTRNILGMPMLKHEGKDEQNIIVQATE
jgi:predicted DNA-binding protein